jgi:hypothetical protein
MAKVFASAGAGSTISTLADSSGGGGGGEGAGAGEGVAGDSDEPPPQADNPAHNMAIAVAELNFDVLFMLLKDVIYR